MNKVIKTNYRDTLLELVASGDTVVVDFSAPAWCVPCQRLAPQFAAAAERSDAKFVEVDVDFADWAMVDYHVQSVPTVLVFKDKKFVKQIANTPAERTVVRLLQDIGD